MIAVKSLIAELENAVHSGSVDKRIATMKRVTDLFLSGAEQLNDEQVGLFDNVLLHLVKCVETRALAELSRRFAPVGNAPIGVVRHLARHDDISVAGPVLSKSERLTTSDLIEIATKKGHEHLLAISLRPLLVEAVTDVLLERGSNGVFSRLAENPGASFSKAGFESLINRAKNDETLAEKVGQRVDIPRHLLHDFVSKATHAVRIKLLATSPPELHSEIKGLLATISRDVIQEIGAENRDLKGAQEFVLTLQRKNQLTETVLCDIAKKCEFEKLAAALAQMTSTRFALIDRLMRTIHYGGLLVVCRAAELKWATVDIILTHRSPSHPIAVPDLEQAKSDYADLNKWTAIRLLGFWQARADFSSS